LQQEHREFDRYNLKINKKTKYFMAAGFFLLVTFTIYSFLFGKLFPYSPVSIGFSKNEIYLKHELSHSLLHQHSGIIRAGKYPAWLLEGIAVHSANQMGTSCYPSKKETYNYIRKGNFMPPEYLKQRRKTKLNST